MIFSLYASLLSVGKKYLTKGLSYVKVVINNRIPHETDEEEIVAEVSTIQRAAGAERAAGRAFVNGLPRPVRTVR